MHRQIQSVRMLTNIFRAISCQDRPAGQIMGILKRNETRGRDIISRVRMNGSGNFVPSEDAAAIIAVHRAPDYTGESSHSCHLKVKDVATFFDYDFLAGPGMQLDSSLIAH